MAQKKSQRVKRGVATASLKRLESRLENIKKDLEKLPTPELPDEIYSDILIDQIEWWMVNLQSRYKK